MDGYPKFKRIYVSAISFDIKYIKINLEKNIKIDF
jgi:hypothetical protein